MNQEMAMQKAIKIAKLLLQGQNFLTQTDQISLPFMARKSYVETNSSEKIEEILLYGSAAKGETYINDLDLIIFDRGFYSPYFLNSTAGADMYRSLSNNLRLLLTHWLGFDEDDPEVQDVLFPKVDLHVLPITFFTSPQKRAEIAKEHKDPKFFQNVFYDVMRYNGETFVNTCPSYFERKYGTTSLKDLRPPLEKIIGKKSKKKPQHELGTAAQVVAHAKWQRSRGRNPSMSYLVQGNPRKALLLATSTLRTAQQSKNFDNVVGSAVLKQGKSFQEMTDAEFEIVAKHIIRTSSSESEIRERLRYEINYPYDISLSTSVPNDSIGREVRELIEGLGGLVMENGAMVMAMMYGRKGNIIFF